MAKPLYYNVMTSLKFTKLCFAVWVWSIKYKKQETIRIVYMYVCMCLVQGQIVLPISSIYVYGYFLPEVLHCWFVIGITIINWMDKSVENIVPVVFKTKCFVCKHAICKYRKFLRFVIFRTSILWYVNLGYNVA